MHLEFGDLVAFLCKVVTSLLFASLTAASAPVAGPGPVAVFSIGPQAGGSTLRQADYRVASLLYRLGRAAEPYCTRSHRLTGLLFHHLGEYAPADQPAAISRFGVDRGIGVLAVLPGSPAAQAGIKAGDVIVRVNNMFLPDPQRIAAEPDEKERRRLMNGAEAQLEGHLVQNSADLTVIRGTTSRTVTIEPVMSCPARARLARSNQPNAFADGRYTVVTTKMLEFARSDDELAVVLSHELAHNILGHPARLEEQDVPKGLLRNFGRNAARVRATEEEADRLGMKIHWAAGFDTGAAIPFWRRLYGKYDPIPTPKLFATHPSLAAREQAIREVLAELSTPSKPGAQRP